MGKSTIKSGLKIPKVSVCVVTYNQEDYIRECIQSIINQEVSFKVEVIIGDDNSTDKTHDIIQEFYEKYPTVIRPIYHARNYGPFHNMISVINAARGEYIAHCDGDDYWRQGKLQKQVDFLDSNPEIAAVFTNAVTSTRTLNKRKDYNEKFPQALYSIFTGSPFVRSSLVERGNDNLKTKMYYEQNKTIYDFEYYAIRFNNKEVTVLGKPYTYYRDHAGGISKVDDIFYRYEKALCRLSNIDYLSAHIQEAGFDLRLARYFKCNQAGDHVSLAEYIGRGRRNPKDIFRLVLPIGLSNAGKSALSKLREVYKTSRFSR